MSDLTEQVAEAVAANWGHSVTWDGRYWQSCLCTSVEMEVSPTHRICFCTDKEHEPDKEQETGE